MPRIAVLLLSLMLGAGAVVLVSCGDEGPTTGIPPDDAGNMIDELSRAQAAFAEGNCAEVEESAEQLAAAATGLEAKGVDTEVTDGIGQGAARLAELAADPTQCEEPTTTDTEKPEPEEPTTTTTTPTETVEEPTTTTTTAEEEPTAPPEEEGDGGPTPAPPGGGSGTGGTGDGDRSAKRGKQAGKKPKREKD